MMAFKPFVVFTQQQITGKLLPLDFRPQKVPLTRSDFLFVISVYSGRNNLFRGRNCDFSFLACCSWAAIAVYSGAGMAGCWTVGFATEPAVQVLKFHAFLMLSRREIWGSLGLALQYVGCRLRIFQRAVLEPFKPFRLLNPFHFLTCRRCPLFLCHLDGRVQPNAVKSKRSRYCFSNLRRRLS